jgi:integrase
VVQILEVLPLLGKSLVATAAFTGLRHGELRGLEWTDYTNSKLAINRSIWKSEASLPKTRASRDSVPVIRQLAEILDAYRKSMGNPEAGVVFHSGDGLPINLDAFTRRVVRPALQAIPVPWYGWHAFRRGLASNLYAMGAQDKVVQRILRHAKPHVTKDCYIKVFDRTLLEAMERLEVQIEALERAERSSLQLKLNFSDGPDKPAIAVAESRTRHGFSAILGHQTTSGERVCVKIAP